MATVRNSSAHFPLTGLMVVKPIALSDAANLHRKRWKST
jgi:hypothetical protein